MNVGKEYIRAGRWPDALKVLEQAVAFDPTALRPRLGLGLTLVRLKRFDDARAIAAEMFRLQPNAAGGYNVLGACAEAEGDLAAAQAAYEKAVAAGPDLPIIQYNCGCFWARQGDAERSRPYLERALALDATLNTLAATDIDLACYRGESWFEELVAFKK